jgi:L-seryl-tRNA(Ser) seleniumtransferase
MLAAKEPELAARAERLRVAIQERAGEAVDVRIVRGAGRAGGGSLPLLELDGPVVGVTPRGEGVDALAARLRLGDPPIVARVSNDALLLDPRTISEVELDFVVRGVVQALE